MKRVLLLAVCIAQPGALAGPHDDRAFVLNDRTNDVLWRIADLNGNGVIDEPGELRRWFDATNTPGTIGPDNPTSLGTRSDGLAAMGDQGLGVVFLLRDLNEDGDALDDFESLAAAGPGNASGVSLAFPTCVAFDRLDELYVVNAGNAFGDDAIYRLRDLNQDGDFQDAGEISTYVGAGAFGPGNGPFSPQEIVFVVNAVFPIGLLRNSSSGLHGVYRFLDINGNGRADDPGEFTVYFDGANVSGVPVSAGFALENDLARVGSVYTLQIATGGVDQLIRLTDLDGNDTAQDAGEAVIAWETGEPDFTAIDLVSLSDGRVLVSDSSSDRAIVLTDLDNDGRFMSPGERADFFSNGQSLVGDLRQMAPILFACYPDCNGDGALNLADFGCFQTRFALQDPYADCNRDGFLNIADFGCFLTRFGFGCP